jgi:hypothetical protein
MNWRNSVELAKPLGNGKMGYSTAFMLSCVKMTMNCFIDAQIFMCEISLPVIYLCSNAFKPFID